MSETNNKNIGTNIAPNGVQNAPQNMEVKGFNAVATMEALNEAMSGECQGLEFSFDRVTLPTGGGTMFQIPNPESEEPIDVKELKGVIVYNLPAYSYYKDKFNGQNNPPECYSIDGEHGVGNPGGNCKECPFNVFGSGENNSKACKNKRMLYILVEGEMFPLVLYLPTGSIKSFTNYVKGNLSRGRRMSQIVTKITLKKVQNSTGIAYSQAVFTYERDLTNEEKTSLTGLIEFVKHYSQSRALQIVNEPDDETLPFGDKADNAQNNSQNNSPENKQTNGPIGGTQ